MNNVLVSENNNLIITNDIRYLYAGAIAGLIGQYIGDVFINYLTNDRDYLSLRTEMSGYIAAVISGGIATYLAIVEKLGLLASVVFGVGLYYAIFEGVSEFFGADGIDFSSFLENYLIDVLIVYIILWFQNQIFEKINELIGEEDEPTFDEIILTTIVGGIGISLYFGYKEYWKTVKRSR